MAGEAKRMARIVRTIVDGHVAGKTDAADKDEADRQRQHTCDEPLRDRKTDDRRRLDLSIHMPAPSVRMKVGASPELFPGVAF
jgi:hypothetical protein